MKTAAVAVLAAIVLWTWSASADAPLLSGDEPDRVESLNREFFAVPSANRKATIVFRRRKPKHEEVWRMSGWHDNSFLSDDGEYLTVGYVGDNLLEADFTASLPMLQFYRRGKLVRSVSLGEIIENMKSLRRTVSHYAWGYYRGHTALHDVAVDTIEGRRLTFDVTTGALTRTESIKKIP